MAKLKLLSTIFSKLSTLGKNDGQVIVSKDSKSLYVDLDGERIEVTDWIDIDTEEALLAILTPLTNKYYYTKDSNKIWRYVNGEWINLNNINDNNTTYTLTKSGSTITLTGSDGSKTSVSDSDTQYNLDEYTKTTEMNSAISNAVDDIENTYATKTELSDVENEINSNLIEQKMLGWTVPSECPIQNEVSGNQFIQKVGRVDLGSLDWTYLENNLRFYATITEREPIYENNTDIYCSKYATVIISSDNADKTISSAYHKTPSDICVRDLSYTDATAFKSANNGVYVYYELATPITMSIDGNEVTERTNDSLESQGLLNKFDGKLEQGYKNISGTIMYDYTNVCIKNTISVSSGDKVTVKFDSVAAKLYTCYRNNGVFVSEEVTNNTNNVTVTIPSGANGLDITMVYDSATAPSQVRNMRVYINNEIDQLKNDLTNHKSTHAPSNAQANIIETVKVNGTALTPSSKAVDITVPTNNNQLTNGAGYITSSGTAKTISDTLPISKGGTGQTTGINAANTLINSLSTGDSTPTDADYYISQYVGGGTTTTTYHRRPMSALWSYIKSKLATVATSGSYNDLSNKPTIPSVGNGTITITQNGASKGTFTTNQSGNTTIALTDNNTTYGVATSSALGLIKSGTDITVDSSGNVSVNDDSHNHVISNVDGLQSALDGKASSSHTHSYLPLSGGTMTGNISMGSGNLRISQTSNNLYLGNSGNAGWLVMQDAMSQASTCGWKLHQAGSMEILNNLTVGTMSAQSTYTLGVNGSANATTLYENGTSLASKYLGINAKAASASSADSVAWGNVTGKPSSYTPSSHTHTIINGVYTGNGGSQPPSYISGGNVKFNMMNCFKGLSGLPTYADCILMDTYTGSDVPYVTGLGIIKASGNPRAYIAVGVKGNTTTWASQAELITTANIGSQSVNYANSAGSVAWGNVSGKPSSFTPASHTHNYAGSSSAGGAADVALGLSPTTISNTDELDSFLSSSYVMKYAKASNCNIGWGSNDGLIISLPWSSTFGAQIAIDDQSNWMGIRTKNNGTWNGWSKIALTTDNVASATKLTTSAGSATQPVYFSDGKPVACTYTLGKSVPSNAVFTDTHYTSHLYVGTSGGTANATSATSNPYLLCVDNTTNRNSIQLKAGSNMSISAVNGVITFSATDTNTTYTLGSFGLTATATELNYCDGVTSNIQTQLNSKASSSTLTNFIYAQRYESGTGSCSGNSTRTYTISFTVPTGYTFLTYIVRTMSNSYMFCYNSSIESSSSSYSITVNVRNTSSSSQSGSVACVVLFMKSV